VIASFRAVAVGHRDPAIIAASATFAAVARRAWVMGSGSRDIGTATIRDEAPAAPWVSQNSGGSGIPAKWSVDEPGGGRLPDVD